MDDEDYKRISEEVAQQLCASMNEFAMVAEESAMALKKYSDVMSKYVLEKSLESFYNMIEKYVHHGSTFLYCASFKIKGFRV